jgi:hypothetical protein
MELVPVRPQPPGRPGPATPRAASRPAAAAHTAKATPPPTQDDLDLITRQAAFDRFMQMRAELDREANALRDLAMEQIKRDDSVMHAWIKLI